MQMTQLQSWQALLSLGYDVVQVVWGSCERSDRTSVALHGAALLISHVLEHLPYRAASVHTLGLCMCEMLHRLLV